MSTSKLDAIRELLKTQSEKHVIQAVWSAYQLTEEEAVRMVKQAQGIDTTVKGYPDPFIVATEWLAVEQGRADGIPVTCAPELKANNHKSVDISWNSIDIIRRKMIDSRNRPDNCNWIMAFNKAIYSEVAPPINFTHLWVTRDTNENTNRVC